MARPPNYGFEKRRKELAAKAKKEARREERRLRKERGGADDTGVGEGNVEGAAPAVGPTGEPAADDEG